MRYTIRFSIQYTIQYTIWFTMRYIQDSLCFSRLRMGRQKLWGRMPPGTNREFLFQSMCWGVTVAAIRSATGTPQHRESIREGHIGDLRHRRAMGTPQVRGSVMGTVQ